MRVGLLFGLAAAAPGQAVRRTFSAGNTLPTFNRLSPTKPDLVQNKLLMPIPLNASEQEKALASIDRHINDEIDHLKDRLKDVLPDELGILAMTNGWTQEKQNALVAALRTGEPTAVYEAWTQGAPSDTAGAEAAARQTEVKRDVARLQHDAQKAAAANQDLSDLVASLGKLATSKPVAAEIAKQLDGLKTWIDIRRFVETAQTDAGAIAQLPTGKIAIIHDPSLSVGSCVVLSKDAVMVGSNQRLPASITFGNAAEALGFSIVTRDPVPETEGEPVTSGIYLVNPTGSGANVRYFVNGREYTMEPGMSQKIPSGDWVVEFDRGGNFGMASYSMQDGTYYFTPSERGWELFHQRFDVVLDNSQNPTTFNYLLNGEKRTVAANRTATISSQYPMVVMFDRGNGTRRSSKSLNFGGTVQIGVNARDNLWDLFPADDTGHREKSQVELFQ